MSDRPPYGSESNPVRLGPYKRIVEVGWNVGGIVIVEVEYIIGLDRPKVNVLAPEEYDDHGINTSDLDTITPEDYEDWFVVHTVGSVSSTEGDFIVEPDIVWQDELNDIWIWDAFLINALGDDTGVEAGNISYGPFKLHYEGMQVRHDVKTFQRPVLGDYIEHTHPNGNKVVYAHGATPLSRAFSSWKSPSGVDWPSGYVIDPSDPGGYPEPPQDLSNTESWYWYHLGHAGGQTVNRVRSSWLVHFDAEHVESAELVQDGFQSVRPVSYTLTGYPLGTTFEVKDSRVTAKPNPDGTPVMPTFQVSESVPGTQFGTLRRFGPTGAAAPPPPGTP